MVIFSSLFVKIVANSEKNSMRGLTKNAENDKITGVKEICEEGGAALWENSADSLSARISTER